MSDEMKKKAINPATGKDGATGDADCFLDALLDEEELPFGPDDKHDGCDEACFFETIEHMASIVIYLHLSIYEAVMPQLRFCPPKFQSQQKELLDTCDEAVRSVQDLWAYHYFVYNHHSGKDPLEEAWYKLERNRLSRCPSKKGGLDRYEFESEYGKYSEILKELEERYWDHCNVLFGPLSEGEADETEELFALARRSYETMAFDRDTMAGFCRDLVRTRESRDKTILDLMEDIRYLYRYIQKKGLELPRPLCGDFIDLDFMADQDNPRHDMVAIEYDNGISLRLHLDFDEMKD